MITQDVTNEKIRGKFPSVQCKLCHADVKRTSKIVRLGAQFGVICESCSENFSSNERELIYNMCTAFGGYYGKLRNENTNNYKVIRKLADQYNIKYQGTDLTSLDIQVLHKAFLYGISPSQIIQSLRILSD